MSAIAGLPTAGTPPHHLFFIKNRTFPELRYYRPTNAAKVGIADTSQPSYSILISNWQNQAETILVGE
jgi:hypothetical protein